MIVALNHSISRELQYNFSSIKIKASILSILYRRVREFINMNVHGNQFGMYKNYKSMDRNEKDLWDARRNIIETYSFKYRKTKVPQRYTQKFMKQVDIIKKKRGLLLQYNLLKPNQNISLTKEDINIGFEQILSFKNQNNIQTTLYQLKTKSANVVIELINEIQEIMCPILLTNNQFGNLSNVLTLKKRIFRKIVESILQNTNELKHLNSSIISILAKNIVQYIPSTPLYPRSKYVLNHHVMKVSYVPIQTNISRQLRKILKILIPRLPFDDLQIEHVQELDLIEIQCARITFYSEIFDWKFEGREWKGYNSKNIDQKTMETILDWLKEGNGLGYGKHDFHTTMIEIVIIPMINIDANYDTVMEKLKILRDDLITDPTQMTILDDIDTVTFGLEIKKHTAQCLKSSRNGIGCMVLGLNNNSEYIGSIGRKGSEPLYIYKRYVRRIQDLKYAVSKLDRCIAEKSGNVCNPNSNGILPVSFDELDKQFYKGSNFYPYGYYQEQKEWKESMLKTITDIYKQTKGEYTPIKTTTSKIWPYQLQRQNTVNGKQILSLILCRNTVSILQTIHPRQIVTIENSNISSIPSINFHSMDINYNGPITSYIQQCYELWTRYTTKAIVQETCIEIQRHKAQCISINRNEVARLLSSQGINKNFNDMYNIAFCNIGFEKQSHHIPYNTIHGVIINVILAKSTKANVNTLNMCYLIFNMVKKQIELINIYENMLYLNCSIQTMLKVIMNDNVNDDDVLSAFQKYSESNEINKSETMEDRCKKRKLQNASRISVIHHDKPKSNIQGAKQVFQCMKGEKRKVPATHEEYATKNWTFMTPSYNNMMRFYQKYDTETLGLKVITVTHNTLYELARRKYIDIMKLTLKKKPTVHNK